MSTVSKVLLSDTWHFHKRNFSSLMNALDSDDIEWRRETRRANWRKRHGDYVGFNRDLTALANSLGAQDPDAVYAATCHGLSLFKMAKAELLCILLAREHWRSYDGLRDDAALFQYAWQHDRKDLLLNLAAAQSWIVFWADVLKDGWTHVVAYSGSYTYTRTLLALAAKRDIKTFVTEHFFTGNEFYMEPRNTPLPNHSLAGRLSDTYPRALPEDVPMLEPLRAEMHLRFAAMSNKNVKTQSTLVPPPFESEGQTLLIIGQVLNDFSLIETHPEPVLSLPTYQRLIRRVLADSDWRIVFKAHPWERKRPHLKSPVTRDAIIQLHESLPANQQQRLLIEEQAPINGLFAYVDQVVTICSQGGLEACQAGFKPATLARAFYSDSGFTSDFKNVDSFADALMENDIQGTLTLDEYRAFEDYMTKTLLLDLYRNNRLGTARLHNLLTGVKADDAWQALLTPPQAGPTLPSFKDIAANPCPWLRDAWRWAMRRAR